MVPGLHAGTPHHVSLRGFERSHPQLVCVLIREMGSVARLVLVLASQAPGPATANMRANATVWPETLKKKKGLGGA